MKSAFLIPQVSVADVKLDDNIENYADRQLQYSDSILGVPYYCYSFNETPVIAFADENGRIESISCDVECLWQNSNLIGMNINDFENLAGQSHTGEVDHIELAEQIQDVYEYDHLGLQIWVFANAIVTVIVCDYRE